MCLCVCVYGRMDVLSVCVRVCVWGVAVCVRVQTVQQAITNGGQGSHLLNSLISAEGRLYYTVAMENCAHSHLTLKRIAGPHAINGHFIRSNPLDHESERRCKSTCSHDDRLSDTQIHVGL